VEHPGIDTDADHAGDTYLPLFPGLYGQKLECYTIQLFKSVGQILVTS
jgi:hypothetical protein